MTGMNEIERAIFLFENANVLNANAIRQELKHIIKALEAQQADMWIPITERLPKEDRCISTYTTLRHKESGHVFSAKLRWYFGKFEWFNGKKLSSKYEVIAWRPEIMPEPYKEG